MPTTTDIADEIPKVLTSVTARFGVVASPGFLACPNVLLMNQDKLGLSGDEMCVLMNFMMHWHAVGRKPFPHAKTIAARTGASHRTVQRAIKKLLDGGFMTKVKKQKRKEPQRYDLDPLVEKLTPFALDALQVTEPRSFDDVLDYSFVQLLHDATTAEANSNIFEVSLDDTPF